MKNLKIRTTRTTEKILRDKVYEDGEMFSSALVFEAAKNEYESAQIILTAGEQTESYTLETGYLRSAEGHLLAPDCFAIYNQKYIEVKELSPQSDHEKFSRGWYPDALLPYEKAVEYGENRVNAGENQAIFISLKVPQDQFAGEYAGEFTLCVGGEKHAVPVRVTVWDFVLPREVHCMSDFVVGSNGLKLGENDYFPEMYRKYAEKLIEFRLAPHRIMQLLNLPYNEGADFVKELRYFDQLGKPYLSTIMLPVYPHPVTGINEPVYRKFALAIAEAADEDGVNYFDRAAVYCGFIDEPQLNGTWDETNRVCKRFEDLKIEVAEEFLRAKERTPFREEIAESMKNVNNYVTIHFDERIKEVKSWCPGVGKFGSAEAREKYEKAAKHGKNWWYQCGVKAGEPNFGIDSPLLDIRLMLWMTYDYHLGGTLYWETVQYFKWVFCLDSHCNHEVAIDCYKEAVRCAKDNGDGFLLYPGKPYGIYGPVESLRLHAIRDGFEEYEYFYLYEHLCDVCGKDFETEKRELVQNLYKDVKVTATSQAYFAARRVLAEKIVALQNVLHSGELK